jgi:hypothetical protein
MIEMNWKKQPVPCRSCGDLTKPPFIHVQCLKPGGKDLFFCIPCGRRIAADLAEDMKRVTALAEQTKRPELFSQPAA